jgi:photosystem II oxygen-evolving enhancer protein 1
LTDMCIEPTSWQVEEEVTNKKGEVGINVINTKLLTRQAYTLNVGGIIENVGGKATFSENDGMDYAPVTLQTPGGERLPVLFTVKQLVATGNGDKLKPGFEMGGPFTVSSYRTGLFMDPKGRGTTVGYDVAVGLQAVQTGIEGDAKLYNENNKRFDMLKGDIEFAVSSVDEANGDFAGVFVSKQPGDTDMGAHEPKNILIKGIWTGHVDNM